MDAEKNSTFLHNKNSKNEYRKNHISAQSTTWGVGALWGLALPRVDRKLLVLFGTAGLSDNGGGAARARRSPLHSSAVSGGCPPLAGA